jgi:hypothetical protein
MLGTPSDDWAAPLGVIALLDTAALVGVVVAQNTFGFHWP